MARPSKQGIDYFPLDVEFDEKTEMFLIEKEAAGLAVLITTWQLIYKNEGYYIYFGTDLFLLIKKRISIDIKVIKDCVDSCIERGIFDKELFNKYEILTSKAVQKRFFDVINRKKEVHYKPEFLLIDVSAYKNLINVDINRFNSGRNATNEIKGKEIKINDIKENEISGGKSIESEIIYENDFIDSLLDLFQSEYKTARNYDYILADIQRERSAIGKLLNHYKKQNPDNDSTKTLSDFKALFKQALSIDDKFLQENMSPSIILTKLNFIKTKLKGEYVGNNKTNGATTNQIVGAIAKAFDLINEPSNY